MNTELMNNVVLKRLRKTKYYHTDIKHVATEGRRNYLVSEPNH